MYINRCYVQPVAWPHPSLEEEGSSYSSMQVVLFFRNPVKHEYFFLWPQVYSHKPHIYNVSIVFFANATCNTWHIHRSNVDCTL